MEISDAAVVAQVLAGDKDAFRLLVDRHTRSIYSAAWRMTGTHQDAEEIVQETFLRAYRSLHSFELRSSFSTWLYRIAVNRSLDFLKAKKMTDTYQISEDPGSNEEGPRDPGRRAILKLSTIKASPITLWLRLPCMMIRPPTKPWKS